MLDSATDPKPAATGALAEHNPAALILPIVEKVTPERLEEVFWRAVALMPNDDLAQKRGTVDWSEFPAQGRRVVAPCQESGRAAGCLP
jgi:hypothetical protein